MIVGRVAADLDSRTESALKTVELPTSILYSQTPATILEKYIRAPGADRKLKKAEAKFVELDERIQQVSRWRNGYSNSNLDIFDCCSSIVRNTIKELIHHRLAGYYFLPKLDAESEDTGFVVLLREVNHLPRELARLIAEGMDGTNSTLSEHPHWRTYIDFTVSDFAMPIGEMTSPEVEHLLQTFSHLFGRIGLPDPDKAKVETLCGSRPQATEANQ